MLLALQLQHLTLVLRRLLRELLVKRPLRLLILNVLVNPFA